MATPSTLPARSTSPDLRPQRPTADPKAAPAISSTPAVADLQGRLGNRGVSVALIRGASPASPEASPSSRVSSEGSGGSSAGSDAAQGQDAEPGQTLSVTDTRGQAKEDQAEGPEAAAGPAGPRAAGRASVPGRGDSGGGSGTETSEKEADAPRASSSPEDTGAGALRTGDLVLIDVELAEHQRWAGALGRIGEVGSIQRAQFAVEAAGGGFINGIASGAGMSLGIGLTTRFVPAVGPILGAGMALRGLADRNWGETAATIARIGEGNDTYEVLANTIASVAAAVEVTSQILGAINGIVGVVEAAAAAITAGAVVAAFFTFGATLGIAAVAGDVVLACQEISEAITVVTQVLDLVNAAVLQPSVVLFRTLHAFTSQADPREVEAQGASIAGAANASGSALGGWIGGKAAQAGSGSKASEEAPAPPHEEVPETPKAAADDGPQLKFLEPDPVAPVAHEPEQSKSESTPASPTPEPSPEPTVATTPAPAAESANSTSSTSPAPGDPEQLSLFRSDLKPITEPVRFKPIKNDDVPQGLASGSVGTYARSVQNPHEAALLSNPPGAPGATSGGGRLPQEGRKDAGLYGEHQTAASAAHEVLPGHRLHGPSGQRREGEDTKDALAILLPESVKPFKDPADRALLSEIQSRKAQGGDVPAIEVIARSAKITQDAIAQSGANVPGEQVSRNFLAEVDQFNAQRFGYQEVRPGEALPPDHPLGKTSAGELDFFLDRTFDEHTRPYPSGPGPAPPPLPAGEPESTATTVPSSAQMVFDFGAPSSSGGTQPSSAVTSEPPSLNAASSAAPVSSMSGQKAVEGTRQIGAPIVTRLVGGKGQKHPDPEAAYRARFTRDNQPAEGVERVNPHYTPPPATPAQIVAIRNQILNLLAVRAAAEREAQHQAARAEHAEQNQAPIQQTLADTAAGISAVQGHDAAVARRQAVNAEQQQRQEEAQGLVAGFPSRVTALAALTVPLAAWQGFTGLASHLPGEAGDKMLQMNREADALQATFGQMTMQMLSGESAGPANQQALQSDQERLTATSQQSKTSDQQLHTAAAGARGLQAANEAALAEATTRKETALDREAVCRDAATEREKHADTLAERLRVWADAHAETRRRAVEATTRRLKDRGYIVLSSSDQGSSK